MRLGRWSRRWRCDRSHLWELPASPAEGPGVRGWGLSAAWRDDYWAAPNEAAFTAGCLVRGGISFWILNAWLTWLLCIDYILKMRSHCWGGTSTAHRLLERGMESSSVVCLLLLGISVENWVFYWGSFGFIWPSNFDLKEVFNLTPVSPQLWSLLLLQLSFTSILRDLCSCAAMRRE